MDGRTRARRTFGTVSSLTSADPAVRCHQLRAQEEIADVAHWLRQALALGCGLTWGSMSVRGPLGVLMFTALSLSAVSFVLGMQIKVDSERLAEALSFEMTRDGFMSSFALFLVRVALRASSDASRRTRVPAVLRPRRPRSSRARAHRQSDRARRSAGSWRTRPCSLDNSCVTGTIRSSQRTIQTRQWAWRHDRCAKDGR